MIPQLTYKFNNSHAECAFVIFVSSFVSQNPKIFYFNSLARLRLLQKLVKENDADCLLCIQGW